MYNILFKVPLLLYDRKYLTNKISSFVVIFGRQDQRTTLMAFIPSLFLGRHIGPRRPRSLRTLNNEKSHPPRSGLNTSRSVRSQQASSSRLTEQQKKSSPNSKPKLADQLDAVPVGLRSSMLHLPEDTNICELGKRHTKIVATIGPATSSKDSLLRLAAEGMNLVRLNMSHGSYDFHKEVIKSVREINMESPFVIGIMLDLGSLDMVRLGEFCQNPVLQKGEKFTLTVRHEASYPDGVSEVSYDGFLEVVQDGDCIQIQGESGNVIEMRAVSVNSSDAVCEVMSPGELKSRAAISIRGKSMNVNTTRANEDLNTSIARAVLGCPPDQLDFAISQRVEYISLSFVESPEQITAVRRLLQDRGASLSVVAKIESADALQNLQAIITAADGVMVARGDLATNVPYEKVPYWQEKIVTESRRHGKPCLISTHFLESMVLYPTPTRAEVTDMTEAVKQRTDALVLTAETASGKFPFRSIATMNTVLLRIESKLAEGDPSALASQTPALITDPSWWTPVVGDTAENIACAASSLGHQLNAKAILSFTQKGLMATLVSRYRPTSPLYAFTATPTVRNKMSLLYGVRPFVVQFEDDPEDTVHSAFSILKERKVVQDGDLVIVVADILGGRAVANEEETKRVFKEMAGGRRVISAGDVRSALRRLGLKVSDKMEMDLGMSEVDFEETKTEQRIKNHARPTRDRLDISALRFDYQSFREFVDSAVEIVHTIQLRYVE